MWTCYENDVAYILLADAHPGEAAIRIVEAEARWQADLPNSIKRRLSRSCWSSIAMTGWLPSKYGGQRGFTEKFYRDG